MYNIQFVVREKRDTLLLNGNILTQNENDIDLTVVKDLIIEVDKEHSFLFKNNNMFRFFDINEDNIIDLSELKIMIDYINEDDLVKIRQGLKIIRDKYLQTHTVMEWDNKGAIEELRVY